jgi:cellulose synthase/poly-beta-1,6-N-acetylglucosamine synthase-like glycosyltransferase
MINADTLLLFLLVFTSLPVLAISYNYLILIVASFKYNSKIKKIMESSKGPINPPKVTIIISSFNERYVIENGLNAATSIDYPKDKLQIIVADDSTDETYEIAKKKVNEFLNKGYDIQIIHREKRDGFKAGALNNARKFAKGDYILIMDADSIPPKDILLKSLPLMKEGLAFVSFKIGHVNRDYSWVSKACALLVDMYETLERAARTILKMPFSLSGACSLIRKDYLEQVGGWSSDVLVDDMDISCRFFLNGKNGLFIRDIIVPGEDPPLLESWKRQTARNAEGVSQCLRKYFLKIWRSRIGIISKIEFILLLIWPFASIGWLTTTLVAALGLLFKFEVAPSLFQNPVYVIVVMTPLIIVSLTPLYVLRLYGQGIRKNLLTVILMYYYQLSMAIANSISCIKGIFGLKFEFFRTPKYGLKGNEGKWKGRYRIGMSKLSYVELLVALVLGALSVLAFLDSSYFLGLNLFAFSVITLWSLFMR